MHKLKLNSWNEWDNLKEVIVGHCSMIDTININHSFRFFLKENVKNEMLERSVTLKRRLSEQRQEDLDNISATLVNMGIVVHRPNRITMDKNFRTPYFEEELIGAENIRDQTLIVGDEIIETTPIWNRRYFENELLKDIFQGYFRLGAKWSMSPKCRMRDVDYDYNFVKDKNEEELRSLYSPQAVPFEMMFDGAQCLRFGYDILMNVSCANHWAGYLWLQRHLGDKFKVHCVSVTDHHIDGMMIPLKEGLVLMNHFSMKERIQLLPKWLQKWEFLQVSTPHTASDEDFFMASANINVNVLPLSPKQTMIFEEVKGAATPLAELLDKNGIDPVVVQLRHSRIFGGGLHCLTLDTVREGKPSRYS